MTTKEIGDKGETIAVEYLEKLGYSILARNYRTRFGEIDVVALNSGTVVFAEVKYRRNNRFADAREHVTVSKRQKIRRAASQWLARYNNESPARFDVLEIYENGEINHIINAFE
ncbi:UPF0102 protein [Clostridia bacterium]|nr:UPF0102 protein [Clostridia bacterium]